MTPLLVSQLERIHGSSKISGQVDLCSPVGRTKNYHRVLSNPMLIGDAGWSSPVARQAHNLKVVGSNPAPATNEN